MYILLYDMYKTGEKPVAGVHLVGVGIAHYLNNIVCESEALRLKILVRNIQGLLDPPCCLI